MCHSGCMGAAARELLSASLPAASRRQVGHLRLVAANDLAPDGAFDDGSAVCSFGFASLGGRFVEVSGEVGGAQLTVGMRLVREAQEAGETVAWVQVFGETFFPCDAAGMGVDLGSLVVVRVPEVVEVARAASKLAQSGGFGLIVCDLAGHEWVRAQIAGPLQSRLTGLIQKHNTALVCLTRKAEGVASQGSLVSLRMQTRRCRVAKGCFGVTSEAIKDKRHGPFWSHHEIHHGPAGLR